MTDDKSSPKQFAMTHEDLCRHLYIVGKTGTGKSTLLSSLILNDIKNGMGVCLLDPHGDLVDTIVSKIPPERYDDVVLWDVSDYDYPLGLDLFGYEIPTQKNLLVS
jgi:DNA helicase HerA-like ATPase